MLDIGEVNVSSFLILLHRLHRAGVLYNLAVRIPFPLLCDENNSLPCAAVSDEKGGVR
jgi:hypothetical protein